MKPDWVFGGSGFWKDESTGREFYRADSGDMICVSNFSSAMLDVPIASSAEANELEYVPYTSRIPKRGTPVRLVLVPIPMTTDQPRARTDDRCRQAADRENSAGSKMMSLGSSNDQVANFGHVFHGKDNPFATKSTVFDATVGHVVHTP